jgi:hypothetical protein
MASAEGSGHVSLSLLRRAETLVRALAGVQDARVDGDAQGHLTAVHVVPAANAQTKAVVRNVQSALRAALNIASDTRSIFVAPTLPQALLESVTPEPAIESVMRDGVRAQPAPRRLSTLANAAVYTNGYRQAPHIELLELQRLGQDQLQCRVVIQANGRRRTGSADAGEENAGAVTLAARATLDALRGMGTGDWVFEGAADVIIGGQRHVVVSIKKDLMVEPVSGAAPVHESVEHAIALAVLNAAGLSGAITMDPERRAASTQRR